MLPYRYGFSPTNNGDTREVDKRFKHSWNRSHTENSLNASGDSCFTCTVALHKITVLQNLVKKVGLQCDALSSFLFLQQPRLVVEKVLVRVVKLKLLRKQLKRLLLKPGKSEATLHVWGQNEVRKKFSVKSRGTFQCAQLKRELKSLELNSPVALKTKYRRG